MLFNMDSTDEEVLVAAAIAKSVLKNILRKKRTKKTFGLSHGCREGLNLECFILYYRK